MHDGNTEVVLLHLVSQFNNSLFGVAIDQSLVDVEVTVEIEEDVHLPFLLFYGDVVLLNTFEGKLLVLDKNLGVEKVAFEKIIKDDPERAGRFFAGLNESKDVFPKYETPIGNGSASGGGGETKTINGVTYKKVNGGWQKQ
jgi:hypothetical protein